MNLMKRNEQEVQKVDRMEVTPVTRVDESDDAFTLTVELPGVAEKDMNLSLERRTLSVTAQNTVERYKDYTLAITEIPEVRYHASFELPERIKADGIKAVNRNGVLVLTLPKCEEVKPRRIEITAG